MGLVSVGFLLFMLTVSNPFERLIPAAIDGRDLNPLLQDPGMVINPPMLYMGYVGFSVAFSFAIAAFWGERSMRPGPVGPAWTTVAWCFMPWGFDGERLGLLRTGLGWLVVLGSGRKHLIHAMVSRNCVGALSGRHR